MKSRTGTPNSRTCALPAQLGLNRVQPVAGVAAAKIHQPYGGRPHGLVSHQIGWAAVVVIARSGDRMAPTYHSR